MKQSGVGREGGRHRLVLSTHSSHMRSLEFFSEVSSVCVADSDASVRSGFQRVPPMPGSMDSAHLHTSSGAGDVKPVLSTSAHHIVNAPKPVGAYCHARAAQGLLFLAGVGPRDPKDNSIPGGPIIDRNGNKLVCAFVYFSHLVADLAAELRYRGANASLH